MTTDAGAFFSVATPRDSTTTPPLVFRPSSPEFGKFA